MKPLLLLLVTVPLIAGDTGKQVRKTLPLASGGRVVLNTFKGTVDVAVWERSEVEIDARLEMEEHWIGGGKECLELADINVAAWPDSVRIRTDNSRLESRQHSLLDSLFNSCHTPLAHYRIRMPASAQLRIQDFASDIKIAGVAGGLEINTHKGTVTASKVSGRLEVKTFGGAARVDYARYDQPARFETFRGDIEVRVPRGSRFDLSTDFGRHVSFDSGFPRGPAVNGGGPPLRLKSFRGAFHLRAG